MTLLCVAVAEWFSTLADDAHCVGKVRNGAHKFAERKYNPVNFQGLG